MIDEQNEHRDEYDSTQDGGDPEVPSIRPATEQEQHGSARTRSSHQYIKHALEAVRNKWPSSTTWTTLATVVMATATAIYAFYAGRQWKAINDQLPELHVAAVAAKDAAQIADKSFKTDARPYVVVDNVWKAQKPDKDIKGTQIIPFAPCSDDLGHVCVRLFYTVTGHTPAIGVRRHIRVLVQSDPIAAESTIDSFKPECPERPEGNPPMSTGNHNWDDPSKEVFPPDEIERMLNDKVRMYVYGAIEYRDLFDRCHVTRFCFVERVKERCAPEGCFDNCKYGNWI